MNIDGYYFWHCDICGDIVAESPNESDPWGYGNLLLVNTGEWLTQVCRKCVADMGDEIRGKGAGFILGGLLYTGPRARQWANEVIERLLDSGDIKEGACGWPVMAMCYGVEEEANYTSLVALVQAAQKLCGEGCTYDPDCCPVVFWAERLEVPLSCGKRRG